MYLCSQRSQFGEAPPKMFGRCPKFFQTVSKYVNKLYFFSTKKLFLKLFSRTSRSQFWQSCRNSKARRPKYFAIMVKLFHSLYEKMQIETTFFSKNTFIPKRFLWTRRKQSWQTSRFILDKCKKFFSISVRKR